MRRPQQVETRLILITIFRGQGSVNGDDRRTCQQNPKSAEEDDHVSPFVKIPIC